MNARSFHTLGAAMTLGLALSTLTHCELLVKLDRGDVDAGTSENCPICTDLADGGDDAGQDAESAPSGDATVEAAVSDATLTEGGLTDASTDATPSDEGEAAAVEAREAGADE